MAVPDESDRLMAKVRGAVKDPQLILRFDRNLFGGGGVLLYLEKQAPNPRSKPIRLVEQVLVAEEGQKQSDMLRMIADLMAEEGN